MDMDMRMPMVTSVASSTVTMAAQAMETSVVTGMGTGTGMSMGGSSGCKLSMLLNWHTIDACFLSSIFHIRSSFTFFLACLGAFFLVVSLEFLRRFQREFDSYLRQRNEFVQAKAYVLPEETEEKLLDGGADVDRPRKKGVVLVMVLEQVLRGCVHVVQFSVSYCIMLLFMYSNGYIIISILVGALVGFALFTRDTLYSSWDTNSFDEMEKTCC